MADPEIPPQKGGWKKVTRTYQPQGGSKRGAAAVNVSEHGATETNVAASGLLDKTAVARGIDATKEYLIDYFVDEARGMIAVHAVAVATPGTTQIRRFKKGRIGFHLGAALEEAPSLRPVNKKVHCLVSEELDDTGLPVMAIPIKAGLAMNTQSRDTGDTATGSKPKTQSSGSQSAPSKDAPSKDTPSKDAPAKEPPAKES